MSVPSEGELSLKTEQALTRWGKGCVFLKHPAVGSIVCFEHKFGKCRR